MHKWNRRHFAKIGAAAALLSPSTARAYKDCYKVPIPNQDDGQDCIVGIASHRFRHVRAAQDSMFGSWAATMQMVLAGNGYYIDQHEIARQTFTKEELTKLAAAAGYGDVQDPFDLMESMEGKKYVDQADNILSVKLRYFGADLGTATRNASIIINQLNDEIPMVYCSKKHMMALVGVSYVTRDKKYVRYPQLTGGWVGDPFIDTDEKPVSDLEPGFRDLIPDEVLPESLGGQLTFIALVNVSGRSRGGNSGSRERPPRNRR